MDLWKIVILSSMEIISFALIFAKVDNRIREKKGKIIVLITLSVVFSAILNISKLPMRAVIVAIFSIILLKTLFNIGFLSAIFNYFTAFIFVYSIQVVVMLGMLLLQFNTDEYIFISGIIMNALVLLFSLCVNKYAPIKHINKISDIYLKEHRLVNTLMIAIIILFLSHSVVWDLNHMKGLGYVPLVFSGIIIWTLVIIIVFLEIIRIREKRKVMEIYNEYNPILQNLMNELKAKQHDIKNHFHAIYGIAEHEGNQQIKEYIENLVESFSKKDKLINTGNIIVSSLIYSKSNMANLKNIDFQFNYEKPIPAYPLKDYEISEVIGNIIDNAIEAIEKANIEDKKIIVNMKNEENLKIIEIQNTAEFFNNSNKDELFKMGFSTKGNKRGYGLYNVEKIVKYYKGFIEISHGDGITSFKLIFP